MTKAQGEILVGCPIPRTSSELSHELGGANPIPVSWSRPRFRLGIRPARDIGTHTSVTQSCAPSRSGLSAVDHVVARSPELVAIVRLDCRKNRCRRAREAINWTIFACSATPAPVLGVEQQEISKFVSN